MKKSILVAGLVVSVMAASAQNVQKDEPPKPPPPPKPMVKKGKDIPPPPPPPDAPPPPNVSAVPPTQDFDAFLKRNKDVKELNWQNDELIVQLKSGKEERYNLNDAQSKKAAEAKYGELPQAPPPPPLPPPPPPPPPTKASKKKSTLS